MKQFTEAEVTAIGEATVQAYMRAASEKKAAAGRAAVAAVAPRVRAEALAEALAEPTQEETHFYGQCDAAVLRAAFRDRLASLTAKPDPIREALRQINFARIITVKFASGDRTELSDAALDMIVAAVDAARGAK